MATTLAPEKKVVAGGTAATATLVLVWVLGELGVDVPPEVASALTALIGVAASYAAPHTPRGGRHAKP